MFPDLAYPQLWKIAKKESFLTEMDQVVPSARRDAVAVRHGGPPGHLSRDNA